MEVLASASSVIAVVSVAIQLAETVQKLIDFLKAVENAPDNIKDLSQDLELLSVVLKRNREVNRSLQFDEITEAVLSACERKVSKLKDKIESLAQSFTSSTGRKRVCLSLKAVLQNKEITSARYCINSAISSLQTVQGTNLLYLQVQTRQDIQLLRDSIVELSSTVIDSNMRPRAQETELKTPANFSSPIAPLIHQGAVHNPPQRSKDDLSPTDDLPASSPTKSSAIQRRYLKTYWATLLHTPGFDLNIFSQTFEFTTRQISDRKTRKAIGTEAYYVLYPNAVGRFLGVAQGAIFRSTSFLSPQYSLETFRAVPQDSLIFQFCIDGNVGAIRRLFERGKASPFDRDPSGKTPLWFAAKHLQLDVAKLLLDEGANPHVTDWSYRKEPIYAVIKSPSPVDVEPRLAMINLLQNHKREDYPEKTLDHMIGGFMHEYRPHKDINMLWKDRRINLLRYINSIQPYWNYENPMLSAYLLEIIRFYYEGDVLKYFLRRINVISIADPCNSVLHIAIWLRLPERDPISFKEIVQKTKASHLHFPVVMERWARTPRTPTMVALFDMSLFLKWRAVIKELGYQTADFVARELEERSVIEAGWNTSSLTYLFETHFDEDPDRASRLFGFPACERCGDVGTKIGDTLRVDLKWRQRLSCIRQYFGHSQSIIEVSATDSLDIEMAMKNSSPTTSAHPEPGYIGSGVFHDRRITPAKTLPYRMVCSEYCRDSICVAWVYEDDFMKEPELLPYPYEPVRCLEIKSEEEVEGREEDFLTHNMPGSFKE